VAIALLLAIQLLVVVTNPADAGDDLDASGAVQLAERALERLDTADGTTTTTPGAEAAPTTAASPTVAPTTVGPAPAAVSGNGTGRSRPPSPPTTQAPPVTAPPARGCGDAVTKADGTPWVCTWADDFDGTALDASHWSPMLTKVTAFSTGGECMLDRPENLQVRDGALHLIARHELEAFTCESNTPKKNFSTQVTSAMVTTLGKWDQAFGRFEVRAQLPTARVPGIATSFWMWPRDPTKYGYWPASGELDLMEWYSRHPDMILPYFHYTAQDGGTNQTTYKCRLANVSDWHTYTLEWTTETLTMLIDGRTCLVNKWNALLLQRPAPFDQPFSLSLSQSIGPARDYQPGVTPMPAETVVDYVRVWR
jgi:beta-glucanase (GH16 family)